MRTEIKIRTRTEFSLTDALCLVASDFLFPPSSVEILHHPFDLATSIKTQPLDTISVRILKGHLLCTYFYCPLNTQIKRNQGLLWILLRAGLFKERITFIQRKNCLSVVQFICWKTFPGWGGGGAGLLPKKLDRGEWPASQNPDPIYDQNLQFSLPYF